MALAKSSKSHVNTPLFAKLIFAYFALLAMLCAVFILPPNLAFDALEQHILINIKLPILTTAVVVGASIAAASACLQVLLRNPLADPGIIGISSGASLMAACLFLLAGAPLLTNTTLGSSLFSLLQNNMVYVLPLLCFAGALISALLIFAMAKWMGGAVGSVILAGIAISTLCSALIGWMFLVARPEQMQSLTFWLMGSFSNTNWHTLLFSAPIAACALALLMSQAAKFNQLYLGEQSAQLVGLSVKRFHKLALVLIAVLIGVSVSIAGSIAFLGLLVPHFVRRLHGNDNRKTVPISALLGASVMIICAIINAHLADTILPISMLTASIGAPLFIYVMIKQRPV
ncbi:FecCD family ABC transporter permease [Ningiella sp. W23]|uniref:FecCD family ABC transporter permease n=1 Tax=Ningiella sp. W23 TaxID=3023715 RepID=UPI003757EF7B